MSSKISLKEFGRCLAYLFAYVVLVVLSEFVGFLSPLGWVLFPAVAAVVAAWPVVWAMHRYRVPFVNASFAFVLAMLLLISGEVWTYTIVVWILSFGLLSEIIRCICGYDSEKGIRWSYPVLALGCMGQI